MEVVRGVRVAGDSELSVVVYVCSCCFTHIHHLAARANLARRDSTSSHHHRTYLPCP